VSPLTKSTYAKRPLLAHEEKMKTTPYWLDQGNRKIQTYSGQIPEFSDVVVVGAGFTGLSCGYHLAKAGNQVVVFDSGKVGAGASGQNGGHVNNGLGGSYLAAKAKYGEGLAKQLYWAYDEAVNLIESIVKSEDIDCSFVRCGKLKAANKPSHFESLKIQYDFMVKEVDPDVELISPDEMRKEIGSDSFHGALLYKKSAQMHMGNYSLALASKTIEYGGKIFEDCPVVRIERVANQFVVYTPQGRVRCKELIVATGPSRSGPFSWFKRRIVPVGSFATVTERLDESLLQSVLPNRRNVTTTNNIGNYIRVLPDNRLLFGGRAKFAISTPAADQECGEILRKTMVDFFPQLANVKAEYCWGGAVDMTSDRLPRIGSHNGMLYAMGYSGHGAQLSTLLGKVLAERVQGKQVKTPFDELTWPPIPGYWGTPWFLPFVGAYFGFKDKIS